MSQARDDEAVTPSAADGDSDGSYEGNARGSRKNAKKASGSGPGVATTNKRKSAAGRKLMRWSVTADQQVLLAVEYVMSMKRYDPEFWNIVGSCINPYLTGEGIKQHLLKLHRQFQEARLALPTRVLDSANSAQPQRDLDLGKKASRSKKVTKKEQEAAIAANPLLRPSKGKTAAEPTPTGRNLNFGTKGGSRRAQGTSAVKVESTASKPDEGGPKRKARNGGSGRSSKAKDQTTADATSASPVKRVRAPRKVFEEKEVELAPSYLRSKVPISYAEPIEDASDDRVDEDGWAEDDDENDKGVITSDMEDEDDVFDEIPVKRVKLPASPLTFKTAKTANASASVTPAKARSSNKRGQTSTEKPRRTRKREDSGIDPPVSASASHYGSCAQASDGYRMPEDYLSGMGSHFSGDQYPGGMAMFGGNGMPSFGAPAWPVPNFNGLPSANNINAEPNYSTPAGMMAPQYGSGQFNGHIANAGPGDFFGGRATVQGPNHQVLVGDGGRVLDGDGDVFQDMSRSDSFSRLHIDDTRPQVQSAGSFPRHHSNPSVPQLHSDLPHLRHNNSFPQFQNNNFCSANEFGSHHDFSGNVGYGSGFPAQDLSGHQFSFPGVGQSDLSVTQGQATSAIDDGPQTRDGITNALSPLVKSAGEHEVFLSQAEDGNELIQTSTSSSQSQIPAAGQTFGGGDDFNTAGYGMPMGQNPNFFESEFLDQDQYDVLEDWVLE